MKGAVVCEQKRASDIGARILRQGGNAVDAIVATTLAVNTLAPYHSDIGGGGFAIIRQPDGVYTSLDFRHAAPTEVTMEFYQKGASTAVGGAAVAVPGQMRGLEELHKKYGRLNWAALITPSIQLARDGQTVGGDLREFTMRECQPAGSDNLAGSWFESDTMYHPLFKDERVLAMGELYYRPELADTLESIAKDGADAFYSGTIASAIVDAVRKRGGLMSLEDLKQYRPIWREPLRAKYRGHALWTVPAPASGAIWLAAMGILDHFDAPGPGTVDDYHYRIEALRLAYGQRTQFGDPDFVSDMENKQQALLSEDNVKQLASKLNGDHTMPPEYYLPDKAANEPEAGTSNITVADEDGLVVSITTTVGLNWGSHIMVPGCGFVLNDSMDDFSVKGRPNATGYAPSPANYVTGGKRPLSSSCPYIVEDAAGGVILAGGSAGGSTIISANVQVAANVLDHGMTAGEALRAARLHNQVLPDVTQLERESTHQGIIVDGFPEDTAAQLAAKGHKVEWVTANRSTPCAMRFLPGPDWDVGGDPRKHDTGGSVVLS